MNPTENVVEFRAPVPRAPYLRPCPFCGGTDQKVIEVVGANSVRHLVECACLVVVPGPLRFESPNIEKVREASKAAAIQRWNTRAITPGGVA